jgi:hypothetical protein
MPWEKNQALDRHGRSLGCITGVSLSIVVCRCGYRIDFENFSIFPLILTQAILCAIRIRYFLWSQFIT